MLYRPETVPLSDAKNLNCVSVSYLQLLSKYSLGSFEKIDFSRAYCKKVFVLKLYLLSAPEEKNLPIIYDL